MAPSRYDWKIVDWDVKPQHNQPTNLSRLLPNKLQLKFENQRKFYRSILSVISQTFSWKLPVPFDMCQIFQKYPYFCPFYYRNDREQNNTFTKIFGLEQKINRPKWNLAHVKNAKNFLVKT